MEVPMQTQKVEVEKARMFRYSISRFSSFGPKQLEAAQEKIKNQTMENCGFDEVTYGELFADLQKENGWDVVATLAYFETSLMFE